MLRYKGVERTKKNKNTLGVLLLIRHSVCHRIHNLPLEKLSDRRSLLAVRPMKIVGTLICGLVDTTTTTHAYPHPPEYGIYAIGLRLTFCLIMFYFRELLFAIQSCY